MSTTKREINNSNLYRFVSTCINYQEEATITTYIDLYQLISATMRELNNNNLYRFVSTCINCQEEATTTTCIDLYQLVSTCMNYQEETTTTTCIDLYQLVSTTKKKNNKNNLYRLVSTAQKKQQQQEAPRSIMGRRTTSLLNLIDGPLFCYNKLRSNHVHRTKCLRPDVRIVVLRCTLAISTTEV